MTMEAITLLDTERATNFMDCHFIHQSYALMVMSNLAHFLSLWAGFDIYPMWYRQDSAVCNHKQLPSFLEPLLPEKKPP